MRVWYSLSLLLAATASALGRQPTHDYPVSRPLWAGHHDRALSGDATGYY